MPSATKTVEYSYDQFDRRVGNGPLGFTDPGGLEECGGRGSGA
jgi:hypothetical protein